MATFYQVQARQPASLLVDPLCCHEENLFPFWEEDLEGQCLTDFHSAAALGEGAGGQVQWDWDDEEHGGGAEESVELAALLSKEAETHFAPLFPAGYLDADPSLSRVRLDAVRWLLKACARHGFTVQTALLAVDYLDRFLSSTRSGGTGGAQLPQPWIAQLSAVACLSLAAKMEETHVPLLLDLQVEEASYVFEARTVQRMELLVLSTLGWRMGSPTPVSYIDYFLRRRSAAVDRASPPVSSASYSITNNADIVNKNDVLQQQHRFQATCHPILLALAADSRWVRFLPSVLAATTMLHALCQLPGRHPNASSTIGMQKSLLNRLNVSQDQVQACSQFIVDVMADGCGDSPGDGGAVGNKRKRPRVSLPSLLPRSPRGVVDATFSCDSYNNSQPVGASTSFTSSADTLAPRGLKKLHSLGTLGVLTRNGAVRGRWVTGCSCEFPL